MRDLKLDLSRKEKKQNITLEGVEATFSELVGEGCNSAPKKEKKKKRKVEEDTRLNFNLDLTKPEIIPSLAPEDFVPEEIRMELGEDFDVISATPPVDFIPNTPEAKGEGETLESIAPEDTEVSVESAAPENYELETKEVRVTIPVSSIAPDDYEKAVEDVFITEETPLYVIPEGYEERYKELLKPPTQPHEEVVEEVLEEEVIQTPEQQRMNAMADSLTNLLKNTKEPNVEVATEAILEHKVLQLEKALYETRRMMLEFAQANTIVGGMGSSSGGGEVWLKYLDDVSVNNIQDGDSLVWDSTLQQFIPSSADTSSVNSRVLRMEEKFISFDDRIQKLLNLDVKFVELEENTTESGDSITPEPITFIDEVADGDTTTFVVTQDAQRNVYELDGIPQPTVQVPRGDIIVFDISGLDDPSTFDIFQNGVVVETGRTRDDTAGSESITIHTGQTPAQYTKLYYRHTSINGLGWIIQITQN